MNAIVPISKGDILDKLPDISVKTVELVLSNMLKEDKIVKIGSYRDARYMKKTKRLTGINITLQDIRLN